MAIVTATITAGAFAGSQSLTISAAVANGATIVVYRGDFLLGSATVASGGATVAVPPLAAGDVIQASVTERGNQAGLPVSVGPSTTASTGWVNPLTVRVTNGNGSTSDFTTADYQAAYGEKVGAVYDPLRAGYTQVPSETSSGSGNGSQGATAVELGFDIGMAMQPGQTTLRVVPRGSENLLVGWNGGALSSPTAYVVTSATNVTVQVQRDDSPVVLNRTVSVSVLPAAAPSTPASGDIISAAYRLYDNGYVRTMINSAKPCEATLVGFTGSWQPATQYGPSYQECDFQPVPSGTYTYRARVIGETNPANYITFLITL